MSGVSWFLGGGGSVSVTPLEDALAAIRNISIVAEHRIRQRLRGMTHRDQLALIQLIQRADNLAWLYSWRSVARGYLLAQLVLNWTDTTGRWVPPNDRTQARELGQWMANLGVWGEERVRTAIRDEISGVPVLQAIETARTSLARAPWDPAHFTDPRNHNPGNFLYIIHALRPALPLDQPAPGPARDLFLSTHGSYYDTSTGVVRIAEEYLANPDVILTEILSCSVISNTHTTTYQGFAFGFILSVPAGNIAGASERDMAAAYVQNMARGTAQLSTTSLDGLVTVDSFFRAIRGSYEYQLDPPATVIAKTNGHNEVLVIGTFGSDRVTVTALFIKVTAKGNISKTFVDDDIQHHFSLSKAMKQCAMNRRIPIVPIVDPAAAESTWKFDLWIQLPATTPYPPPSPVSSLHPSPSVRPPVPRPDHEAYYPPMGLTVGRHASTYRTRELVREYDHRAIENRLRILLTTHTPEQAHRQMHDREGIPHEVIQAVMRQLGQVNYI